MQPEIADVMGVSLSTVNRAHMAYDHGGRTARREGVDHVRGDRGTFARERARTILARLGIDPEISRGRVRRVKRSS